MPQDDEDANDHGLRPTSSSSIIPCVTTPACTKSANATTTTINTSSSNELSLLFAALQEKCGASGSIPLAALMMLNRWSLALDRPGGIPAASMARKARLMQQLMSPSPSLRAETEQELLGSHDAASGGSTSPFMYDIPLLSSPSRPPPVPAAGPVVVDPPQPPQPSCSRHFSDSRRYVDSRSFYARQNAEAFEAIVPYGVTTNAFIVDAYVRCILAYLADIQHHYDDEGRGGHTCSSTSTSSSKTDGSNSFESIPTISKTSSTNASSRLKIKVYIIELAAGHCLFGYLLAKRLLQAQEEGTVPSSSCWSICVLMTDFNQPLLESRMQTPWMQPFVAAGLVEFAVLDAASSSSQGTKEEEEGKEAEPLLLLGKEKRVLAPGSVRGPVFVIGNYALDSFPADIFIQSKTQGLMEVREEEETGRLTLVPSSSVGAQEGEGEGEREKYPYQGLLQALVERGKEGVLHVVNVGFVRLLERIRELLHPEHQGHLALLLADGTFKYDDPTWRVQDLPGTEEEEGQGEEEGKEGHDVKPSNRKRKRKVPISLPDMSPGPGSGCFALAMDPQAVLAAALWALRKEEGGKKGKEEGERWLAVRNTVVEGSLTVTLLARTEERGIEGGREGSLLPRTREAFWRRVCLQNPTDFEHLQGLVLEESDGSGKDSSGTKSLVACLGLDGMLALLRWSGYDGDLFLALRWPLRDAMRHCLRPNNGGVSEEKQDVPANVVEVVRKCLSNRMVLSARAWAQTRYWGVQFLYALGCYREAVDFFVPECGGPALLSSASIMGLWKEEYNERFRSAAEAFLVAMSLKYIQAEGAAMIAHQILMGVMEGQGQKLRDGKGRRRIVNYLEKAANG